MEGYRTLDEGVLAEKAAPNARAFLLLAIDNQYFFTNRPGPDLVIDGVTYKSVPLEYSGFTLTSDTPLNEGTIKLGNADASMEMSGYVLNNLFTDKTVTLTEVFFTSNDALLTEDGLTLITEDGLTLMTEMTAENSWTVKGTALLASGLIDGQSGDEMWIELKVSPYMFSWLTPSPRRIFGRMCGWVFKGEDCGYTGSETMCHKTYERCTAMGNTYNFASLLAMPRRGTVFTFGSEVITITGW